jgi:hypothetical protein
MIAIESNGLTIALAKRDDVIECADEATADTLRSKGYVYVGDASRQATHAERDAYNHWHAGGAC